jgi:hypothetical protein
MTRTCGARPTAAQLMQRTCHRAKPLQPGCSAYEVLRVQHLNAQPRVPVREKHQRIDLIRKLSFRTTREIAEKPHAFSGAVLSSTAFSCIWAVSSREIDSASTAPSNPCRRNIVLTTLRVTPSSAAARTWFSPLAR